mmetsp:Transcript_15191/g.39470  ORF Transcript_15191/g.39470 Transcript_15191/m.39470 type:complete len:221 (-) Transcript_15191:2131-2793(-)
MPASFDSEAPQDDTHAQAHRLRATWRFREARCRRPRARASRRACIARAAPSQRARPQATMRTCSPEGWLGRPPALGGPRIPTQSPALSSRPSARARGALQPTCDRSLGQAPFRRAAAPPRELRPRSVRASPRTRTRLSRAACARRCRRAPHVGAKEVVARKAQRAPGTAAHARASWASALRVCRCLPRGHQPRARPYLHVRGVRTAQPPHEARKRPRARC